MVAKRTMGVPQALPDHGAISGSVGMQLQEQTAPKPWQRRALAFISATLAAMVLVSAPPFISLTFGQSGTGAATGGFGVVRNDMLFDFNKAEIKPEAAQTLDKLGTEMTAQCVDEVIIEGYADAKGPPEYNLALSQRRAEAVKDWLVTRKSIPASVITTRGLGEAQPVAPNTHPDGSDNPQGRQLNRRVEVEVTAEQGSTEAPPSATAGPLHTSGRWIVDESGKRVKLASVNWDGFESPEHVVGGLDHATLGSIVCWIKELGFNSVRLPWSNEMYHAQKPVEDRWVRKNPALKGKKPIEIMDTVIETLGQAGLMVILDNHVSYSDWCCPVDNNSLWYNPPDGWPESQWLSDWRSIAKRYKGNLTVVGAELRNEVRETNATTHPTTRNTIPVWGSYSPHPDSPKKKADWKAAAETAGNAVLAENHDLLIIVGGLNYQNDLRGVGEAGPIQLSVPNRLVYAPHLYVFSYNEKTGLSNYTQFHDYMGQQWGYILEQGKPYTAPLWISEVGTCMHFRLDKCTKYDPQHPAKPADESFSNWMQQYLRDGDIDFAYWQLGSTQQASRNGGRHHGAEDWYGLMNMQWNGPSDKSNVERIKALIPATQGPH
jgi:endoglucanase